MTPDVRPENIPDELKERDQWLFWNASSDKPRKALPTPAADYGASWSDPDEWLPFAGVLEGSEATPNAGLGYVNAKDNDDYARGIYGTIDIDGCVDEDGRPKDWLPSLQPFFDHGAYMEFSPSMDEDDNEDDPGIHIPVVGLEKPEWWTDEHFTAEEHEGVELLTNKFSTVTGNRIKGSGETVAEHGEWLEDWLLEAYRSITGDDPLEDDSAGERDDAPVTSTTSRPGDGDEWMTPDLAEEALEEIDPDVSYPTWKDIGMALSNHFGTSRGGSLFKQWSRGGSKWDKKAKRQADRIIGDAGNYNYDVPTLIKHAQDAGWDASAAAREATSARADGGAATENGAGSTVSASADSPASTSGDGNGSDYDLDPDGVLQLAIDDPLHPLGYDEDGNLSGSIRDVRTSEKAHYVWDLAKKTGDDNVLAQFKGPLYSYDGGVWRDDDGQRLREIGGRALDSAFSKAVVTELEERVRMDRTKQPDELGAPDGTIVTENGLLNLRDRETEPVKPEHYALSKIPTEFDPDAECPRWEQFVAESVDTEAERKKLQEYAGYTLWHHSQDFGKAMFFVGPTDSGKGTALKAIKQVLGRENVAAESLHDLIQTRWGTAQLFGNVVNIRNEVTPSGLGNVQKFKELTGGEDEISAEFKGQDKFSFVVTQKFLFSTNEVPTVENADEAFYNRLLFVRFPNTVPAEDQDKQLLDKLADERSGMLNWMLDGLNRLLEQGQFTGERSINGKKEICDAFGGVLDRFTHHCLMVTGDADDCVKKSDLHDLAKAYADDIDKEPEWDTQTGFTREVDKQRGISQGQKRIDGTNHKVFRGVQVKPETVYRYGMEDDLTAVTADDGDDVNDGLENYADDQRPGFDSRTADSVAGDEDTEDADETDETDDEGLTKPDKLDAVESTLEDIYTGKAIDKGALCAEVADRHDIAPDRTDHLLEKLSKQRRVSGYEIGKIEPYAKGTHDQT